MEVKRGRPLGPTSRDLSLSSSARRRERKSSSSNSSAAAETAEEEVSDLASDLDLPFLAFVTTTLLFFTEYSLEEQR